MKPIVTLILLLPALMLHVLPAIAAEPQPWQLNLQPAASPIKEQIAIFHDILLVVIFAISAFVLLLLAYTCFRFRRSANPVPSKTTHNTFIEVIWTAVPVIILVALAIPSYKLLKFEGTIPETEMTLKVVGYQWYWGYEYPDHGGLAFDSNIVKTEVGDPLRLLRVDNEVVLPVDTNIRIYVTAADVLHSWAVPAFGIKTDAMPGRLNETWVRITKPGKYYGQCSELCGVYHGFMPIVIRAVPKDEFNKWIEEAKKKLASTTNTEQHEEIHG